MAIITLVYGLAGHKRAAGPLEGLAAAGRSDHHRGEVRR